MVLDSMEIPRDRYHNSEEAQGQGSTNCFPSSSSSAAADIEEREYMFEKVVTPSDVGKLNRLVIPKQHAERYFPLNPAENDKGGLLLSFEEDRTGRPWRFRYSYWNSSQSYVMTKGWSRFVKDKRLDAGDTVTFSRSSTTGSLFIDWRRRPPPPAPPHLLRSSVIPWTWQGGLFVPPPLSSAIASTTTNTAAATYFRSAAPAPPVLRFDPGILNSVPVLAAEPKRMRLFGVNLECSERDGPYPQRASTNHLPPPSPLQWRLSPTSSPSSSEMPQPPQEMDDQGTRR